MYTYVCIYSCLREFVGVVICVYICVCLCKGVHICICIYLYMCMNLYSHMYTCKWHSIHVYIYTEYMCIYSLTLYIPFMCKWHFIYMYMYMSKWHSIYMYIYIEYMYIYCLTLYIPAAVYGKARALRGFWKSSSNCTTTGSNKKSLSVGTVSEHRRIHRM